MSAVERNNSFIISNPYDSSNYIIEEKKGAVSEKTSPERDSTIELADRITDWAQKALFDDPESQIDFIHRSANFLDSSLFTVVSSIQLGTIVNSSLHLHLEQSPIWSSFSRYLQILSFPLGLIAFLIALIQGGSEFVQMKRTGQFLYQLNKPKNNSLGKLLWIQQNYLTLNSRETSRIYRFIEKALPELSLEEKRERFEKIAEQAMAIRFEELQRRITPEAAQRVSEHLFPLLSETVSLNPSIQKEALAKADRLFVEIGIQAKKKVAGHCLALTSVALTIASIALVFFSIGSGGLLLALSISAAAFSALSYLNDKGVLSFFFEVLKDTWKAIPQKAVPGDDLPKLPAALQRSQS